MSSKVDGMTSVEEMHDGCEGTNEGYTHTGNRASEGSESCSPSDPLRVSAPGRMWRSDDVVFAAALVPFAMVWSTTDGTCVGFDTRVRHRFFVIVKTNNNDKTRHDCRWVHKCLNIEYGLFVRAIGVFMFASTTLALIHAQTVENLEPKEKTSRTADVGKRWS